MRTSFKGNNRHINNILVDKFYTGDFSINNGDTVDTVIPHFVERSNLSNAEKEELKKNLMAYVNLNRHVINPLALSPSGGSVLSSLLRLPRTTIVEIAQCKKGYVKGDERLKINNINTSDKAITGTELLKFYFDDLLKDKVKTLEVLGHATVEPQLKEVESLKEYFVSEVKNTFVKWDKSTGRFHANSSAVTGEMLQYLNEGIHKKTIFNQIRLALILDKKLIDKWFLKKLWLLPVMHRLIYNKMKTDVDIMVNRIIRINNSISDEANSITVQKEEGKLFNAINDYFGECRYQNNDYKGLTSLLNGKEGVIRKTVLKNTVDYSSRGVINCDPRLSIDEIGLPTKVYNKILEPILESDDCGDDKIVMHTRAPVLHKHGVQSLKATTKQGSNITHHPLINPGFNADFDGDQMAQMGSYTPEAMQESKVLLSILNNIYKQGTGSLLLEPTQDLILGLYYLFNYKCNSGDAIISDNIVEDFINGKIVLQDVQSGKTVKDILIGKITEGVHIPAKIDKASMFSLIAEKLNKLKSGSEKVAFFNLLCGVGFRAATLVNEPLDLPLLNKSNADEKLKRITEDLYEELNLGLITTKQYMYKIIEETDSVYSELSDRLKEEVTGFFKSCVKAQAKGNQANLEQMFVAKGNVVREGFNIFIKDSFTEGMSPIEAHLAANGARKALIEKSKAPAKTGELQRKMLHQSIDTIITNEDCGTKDGITLDYHLIARYLKPKNEDSETKILAVIKEYCIGKYTTDGILITSQYMEDYYKRFKNIEDISITMRSVITCKKPCCAKCYGIDWSTRKMVTLGTAVGVLASQSIGELATQLSMNSFHSGGRNSGIVQSDFDVVNAMLQFKPKSDENGDDYTLYDVVAPVSGEVTNIEYRRRAQKYLVEVVTENGLDYFEIPRKLFEFNHLKNILNTNIVKGKGLCITQKYIDPVELGDIIGITEAKKHISLTIFLAYYNSSRLKSQHTDTITVAMSKYVGIGNKIGQIVERSERIVNDASLIEVLHNNNKSITQSNNALKKLAYTDIKQALKDIILFDLDDDYTSGFSRIMSGNAPISGSAFFKDSTEYERRKGDNSPIII